MKKVIFINRYFYPDLSATSQILSDIAFDLAKDSDSVYIVCSNQLYQNPAANLLKSERVNNVNIIRVKSTNFGRKNIIFRSFDYLTFYINTFLLLLNLSSKNDLLVFKTDPPMMSLLGYALSKIKNIIYINWLQDIFPEIAEASFSTKAAYIYKPLKIIRDKSLSAAKMNVVIGINMKNLLIKRGIDRSKIEIINNWSDSNSVAPIAKEENSFIKDWGISDKFIVGYSGNFGRVHEAETILDSVSSLREHKDIVFLFIGGGKKFDYIKQYSKKNNIENILFKPYQDREDLAHSLSCSDVHIVSLLPKIEGLVVPSKLYGIMAVGRPVLNVGSQTGEVANTLRKHDCGSSIEPGQSSKLTQNILLLKDDKTLLNRLGRNARNAFLNYYDKNIALRTWKRLILKHFD